MVDALSIAPKAGRENNPILIASEDGIGKESLDWLKEKNPEDIYFIGVLKYYLIM
ncbi:Putative cell wall binding repeat 2 [Peptostreptococcus anaerobius]|uniref:Cell wall binding repeat 2 n=1 Tax=Peptostreptococcus anaerobius TaxID=1261 RepID=A0A379C6X6_9FIRM|nr:Putative cell wall binding repeat 2 [Peptostreptococcus anaerobius]